MLFRLLQQMIKDRSKMKARESSLPEKSFSRRKGAIFVPTDSRAARAREKRGGGRTRVRAARPRSFRFCCENVRAKCSTRPGTIQHENSRGPLDIGGTMM
jgi:hypothetical protein